jgi:hypothetical protein
MSKASHKACQRTQKRRLQVTFTKCSGEVAGGSSHHPCCLPMYCKGRVARAPSRAEVENAKTDCSFKCRQTLLFVMQAIKNRKGDTAICYSESTRIITVPRKGSRSCHNISHRESFSDCRRLRSPGHRGIPDTAGSAYHCPMASHRAS